MSHAPTLETTAQGKLVEMGEIKSQVLKEFPSAWFNQKERTIEGYTHGLILGRGSVNARSIEKSAWVDAAERLRGRR